MALRHSRPLSPDRLWPLVALALFVCVGALVPIGPLDFWWHLALGRSISLSGAVPTVDTFSWALPPETPFVYQSWLSEWLLYQLYAAGGLGLIVLTRNLLLLSAYALIGLEAWRRSQSGRLAALAIGGAGLMTLNNLTVRPQMFSWLLFAATFTVLSRFRTSHLGRRWLLLLPPIVGVWANLHGAFAVGLGLIGVTIAGETLKLLLRRWHPLPPARLAALWLAGLGCGAALLVNPRGLGVVGYVRGLVGNPAVRQLVIEWQRADLLSFPGILLALALVLAALLWLRQPERFDPTDALLLLAFGWLGWSGQRNLIWFGMVAWPIVAGLLRARRLRPAALMPPSRPPALVGYGLAAALGVPLLLVQPPLKGALDLPPVFGGLGRSVPEGSLIEASTPVAATAWLRAHPLPPDARLFHDMGYGSYLMWALPEVRVFADPRIELYPLEHWRRYQRIARNEQGLAELAALNVSHALLSRAGQPELIAALAADPGWAQRYADEQAVFFERIIRGQQL